VPVHRSASDSDRPGPANFVTTHWSAVVRAAHPDSAEAQAALGELCRNYWYPLYTFVRRQGHGPHDAEDLTQEFFARLLEKNFVAEAHSEKGRFRTFLLTALKRFLANQWDRQHARKRGGFQTVVPIDADLAESRLRADPAHEAAPDELYERQWAMTLLDQVMARLQEEYASTDRSALFEQLRGCLTQDDSARPYAEIASQLRLTEAAVKMSMHRLRSRYREVLRSEIGKTVSSPEEVEDEISHLFTTFSP
jgi:RNA polymerase sigma-70 factor (ECF subfamily)